MKITCFKAYDLRGRLGEELNEEVAFRVGVGFAKFLNARRIALGADIRPTSAALKAAVAQGIRAVGCEAIDLGMTGTEETYFAAMSLDVDGAVEVTASHNPMDYNGMKFVAREARPLSGDNGLPQVRALAEDDALIASVRAAPQSGGATSVDQREDYVSRLLQFVPSGKLPPLKIVFNAGNGAAGPTLDAIEQRLKKTGSQAQFIKVHNKPDGTFPNGIPNPILPSNRAATADAVRAHKADLGVAFDGDFDRCFLFDESGEFIEGYYIVGMLAEALLSTHPGGAIVHDPRLIWNTQDVVKRAGGRTVMSKAGHAFIKEKMRAEDALYGGEMSAHHYFRDFGYCDSGMIPWLLTVALMGHKRLKLSALVSECASRFPCSGEINYRVQGAPAVLGALEERYGKTAQSIERVDGLSFTFPNWRFNARASNTEPLLRLNVESRGDAKLMQRQTKEIADFIEGQGGTLSDH